MYGYLKKKKTKSKRIKYPKVSATKMFDPGCISFICLLIYGLIRDKIGSKEVLIVGNKQSWLCKKKKKYLNYNKIGGSQIKRSKYTLGFRK